MKRVFAAVYVLVLLTQLPHVYNAYANLEQSAWAWTAWGAAIAFEASILCFTYRIVVERSKRRTTRLGLGFFLLASCVANATYYGLAPQVFAWLMPVFATVALPASLALFASEFGAEVVTDVERSRREERKAAKAASPIPSVPEVTEEKGTDTENKEEPTWNSSTFKEHYPTMLEMTGRQIAEIAHVSERTGNNWKRTVRNNGHGEKVAEVEVA